MRIVRNCFGAPPVTPPNTLEQDNPVVRDSTLGKKPWELTFDELQHPTNITLTRVVSSYGRGTDIDKPGKWWSTYPSIGKNHCKYDDPNYYYLKVAVTKDELEELVPKGSRGAISEVCFDSHPVGAEFLSRQEFNEYASYYPDFLSYGRSRKNGKVEICCLVNEENWLIDMGGLISLGEKKIPQNVLDDFRTRALKPRYERVVRIREGLEALGVRK